LLIIARLRNGISLSIDSTIIQDIFKLLDEVVAEDERIPGLIQLFTVLVAESIRSDHPSHEYFVERYQRGREMYVSQFNKLNLDTDRPDIDLDELASLIMAVMDGLQIQWLLDPGKVNIVATFKLFSRIVLTYLEK
jgi:hypothetical protein